MLLKDIFPDVSIKQDLFHVVQRFTKVLKKKNTVHRELANDYGKIFRNHKDIGDNRTMETPDAATIKTNLENFLAKWRNSECDGVKVLTNEHWSAIQRMSVHIDKGCFSGIPAHCSTSVNERLHKDMKKVLCKNRLGVQLAYAKFSRYFFRHNQQRGDKLSINSLLMQQIKNGVNQPTNVNDITIGVRSKHKNGTMSAVDTESRPSLPLGAVTEELLVALNKAIENERLEFQNNVTGTTTEKNHEQCTVLLQHALSIYQSMEFVKSVWSSKPINVLKVLFLYATLAQNSAIQNSTSNTGRKVYH